MSVVELLEKLWKYIKSVLTRALKLNLSLRGNRIFHHNIITLGIVDCTKARQTNGWKILLHFKIFNRLRLVLQPSD